VWDEQTCVKNMCTTHTVTPTRHPVGTSWRRRSAAATPGIAPPAAPRTHDHAGSCGPVRGAPQPRAAAQPHDTAATSRINAGTDPGSRDKPNQRRQSEYAHRRAAVSRHGSDPTLSNLSASSCTSHKTQERIASRASRSNTDLARTNARPVAALNNDSYPCESRCLGSCAA
jgi:hypothetical protein